MSLTTTIKVTRKRGDTYPIKFLITSDGQPLVITGYSFVLTVDPSATPTSSANNLFSVAGTITDADAGAFEFRPTAEEMDITPGTYFYDVEMTDADDFVATVAEGKFVVKQDIKK